MQKIIFAVALIFLALNSTAQMNIPGGAPGYPDAASPMGSDLGGSLGGATSSTAARTNVPSSSAPVNNTHAAGTTRGNEFGTLQEQQAPSPALNSFPATPSSQQTVPNNSLRPTGTGIGSGSP